MQAALGLIQDHLVAAPHKDGHGTGIGAPLNDQHVVLGSAKRDLSYLQ